MADNNDPIVLDAPPPDQGAPEVPGAQAPESPPGGTDAVPELDEQGNPKAPPKTDEALHPRINELTFHRRRAERVAAEAIQENQALRQYLANLQSQQQPPGNRQQQDSPPQQDTPPRQEDFSDWGAYTRALTAYEVRQTLARDRQQGQAAQQAQQRALAEAQQAHEARVREATLNQVIEQSAARWPDFEQVVANPQLPSLRSVHPAVLDAVTYSDKAGDLLYYLGKNAAEAVRIANLPPVAAVREIGKLEARIASGTVQSSAAPPPVSTVGARSSGADPTSDRASIDAWMKARNRQVAKRGR